MSEREAGRALDAEVAEKVMSQEVMTHGTPGSERLSLYHAGDLSALPPYSTDIAAAWEVVEKLQERGLYVSISKPPDAFTWDVRGWNDATNDNRFIAHAETAPLTICLAALAALRATEDGDTTP